MTAVLFVGTQTVNPWVLGMSVVLACVWIALRVQRAAWFARVFGALALVVVLGGVAVMAQGRPTGGEPMPDVIFEGIECCDLPWFQLSLCFPVDWGVC